MENENENEKEEKPKKTLYKKSSSHLDEEEDFKRSELDKPLNIPIQKIDLHYQKETKFNELERKIFQIHNKKYISKIKKIIDFKNPIREKDPLFKGEKNPEIYSLGMTSEKDAFAAGYSDGEIHIYQKEVLKIIQDTRDTILSLKFHPLNEYILLSISHIGEVVYTHVPSGKRLNSFVIEDNIVRCLDYNARGDRFAISFADGSFNIYNDNTQIIEGKVLPGTSYSKGHVNQIHSIVFDKQNYSRIITGGRDKRIMIWDIRNLKCIDMVIEPYILGDCVDIKGNYIIAGSYDEKDGVLLYDVRKFKEPIKRYKTDSCIYCCKFSKNEKDGIFATGGYKRNIIKVYDINLEKDDYLFGIEGADSPVYAVDFNKNGTQFVYGCGDGGVRIVNI